MPAAAQREVIVEFERVQVVRKRAKTHLRICTLCGKQTDFLTLEQAAVLFEAAAADILRFVRENSCHLETGHGGDIHICLGVLLKRLRERSCDVHLLLGPAYQLEK